MYTNFLRCLCLLNPHSLIVPGIYCQDLTPRMSLLRLFTSFTPPPLKDKQSEKKNGKLLTNMFPSLSHRFPGLEWGFNTKNKSPAAIYFTYSASFTFERQAKWKEEQRATYQHNTTPPSSPPPHPQDLIIGVLLLAGHEAGVNPAWQSINPCHSFSGVALSVKSKVVAVVVVISWLGRFCALPFVMWECVREWWWWCY